LTTQYVLLLIYPQTKIPHLFSFAATFTQLHYSVITFSVMFIISEYCLYM